MKLQTSPLFFFSIGLVCFGVYIFFSGPWGYESLEEQILGIIWIGAGVLPLLIYGVFRITFKKRVKQQRIVEFILVSTFLFIFYKKNGGHQFILPHNYQGYIIIIYGVENAPKLKRTFYSNKTYVKIPPSGVVVTSSLQDENYSHSAIFLDSTLGRIDNLSGDFKRFGSHYISSSLTCYSKPHLINIWAVVKDSIRSSDPNWEYPIERKLNDLCIVLNK